MNDYVDPRAGEPAEILDEQPPEPIELAPLTAHFGSPILERRPEHIPAEPEVTVPVGPIVRLAIRIAAPAILAAVGVYLVAGLPAALLVAVGGSFARLTGWLGRRAHTTFGEGFLAFRGELGWPHGVQEDDDMHWQWSAAPLPGASGSAQANGRDLPGAER